MPRCRDYCHNTFLLKYKTKRCKKYTGRGKQRKVNKIQRDMSWENNDRNTETKLLQSSPLLHQRQTKQNHLDPSSVPLSPADLETAVTAAMIDFKEITRHFPLSKIIHYAPIEKHQALSVSKMLGERGVGRDSGGENSNILKCARETKRVHEGGSGLQKSNQKPNWVAQQIDIQI